MEYSQTLNEGRTLHYAIFVLILILMEYSQTIEKLPEALNQLVLILILMEYSQTVKNRNGFINKSVS